jgi:hypothetical protein
VLVKLKGREDINSFFEYLNSSHSSITRYYLCDLIGLLERAKSIKDPAGSTTNQLIIPSDKKFEKVFLKEGNRICKIQDETSFRKEAEIFLKEYFEEFNPELDSHGFC